MPDMLGLLETMASNFLKKLLEDQSHTIHLARAVELSKLFYNIFLGLCNNTVRFPGQALASFLSTDEKSEAQRG